MVDDPSEAREQLAGLLLPRRRIVRPLLKSIGGHRRNFWACAFVSCPKRKRPKTCFKVYIAVRGQGPHLRSSAEEPDDRQW